MSQKIIQRIRETIRFGRYDMTAHEMVEMAEDDLDILDIEQTILYGQIIRTEKDDPRGTKYILRGTAVDNNIRVEVVGRFKSTGNYLIITVYDIDK